MNLHADLHANPLDIANGRTDREPMSPAIKTRRKPQPSKGHSHEVAEKHAPRPARSKMSPRTADYVVPKAKRRVPAGVGGTTGTTSARTASGKVKSYTYHDEKTPRSTRFKIAEFSIREQTSDPEIAPASPDVRMLCDIYGLRREELSRLTGFSLRALADWSAGKLPSQPAHRRLREVRRFLDALAEIVKPTAIQGWMRSPNPAFEGLTPLQVIELGEIDRLWAMVHERN